MFMENKRLGTMQLSAVALQECSSNPSWHMFLCGISPLSQLPLSYRRGRSPVRGHGCCETHFFPPCSLPVFSNIQVRVSSPSQENTENERELGSPEVSAGVTLGAPALPPAPAVRAPTSRRHDVTTSRPYPTECPRPRAKRRERIPRLHSRPLGRYSRVVPGTRWTL